MPEKSPYIVRTYKYRIYPSGDQVAALEAQLAECCDLYNAALEHRKRMWREHGVPISYYDQQRELTVMRAEEYVDQHASCLVQRGALVRLDRAFKDFFARVRRCDKPGYPRFRSVRRYDTLEWGEVSGWHLRGACLKVQNVGTIRVRLHRELPDSADLRTLRITRRASGWYACITARITRPARVVRLDEHIGVDLGVTHAAALSNGVLIDAAPADDGAIRRAQRRVSRRKKGSVRRGKAAVQLARLREHEANQRRDRNHKFSRQLVDAYTLIAIEDLKIKNMVRSAKGTVENPGTNVAQKSVLNRSISQQGWGQLIEFLTYKAEEAGTEIVKVNPAYTSQTCAECGVVDRESRKKQHFCCTFCGHQDHADANAAKNILQRAGGVRQALTMSEEARVA